MTDRDRAISRIRKLRALAAPDSGATGPERESAHQRADRLMVKHRLSPNDVAPPAPQPRPRPAPFTPPAPQPIWFTGTGSSSGVVLNGQPTGFVVHIIFQ